ncbi:lipoate--protein ligase family protein [Aquifex aeolicus]|uniref:BPL/LPL catalytic domain-containing protein n=1 Tax=Aquifex aeolicus (strain VF5) TaxID=224324 RepID=O66622_AQUAE|nr:lipoate--protein ligase family protein [Aquifex aeolicus]AAC06584.1 putative protein [Aquifex aeolicus VF5]
MRFLGFGIFSPEENMKIDEELQIKLENGEIEPCFRLYKWKGVCVSLGRNQEEKEFPVKVVRRPTGGGALLHGWDLSFCIVDYKNGRNFMRFYREVSKMFYNIFKEFGVNLKFERNKSYSLQTYYCYFFPTFGELKTEEGKKVVAIAMRELKNTFLLHGSVYVDFDYNYASKILNVKEEELRKRVTTLKELGISEEDFKTLLCSYLSSLRGRAFHPHT